MTLEISFIPNYYQPFSNSMSVTVSPSLISWLRSAATLADILYFRSISSADRKGSSDRYTPRLRGAAGDAASMAGRLDPVSCSWREKARVLPAGEGDTLVMVRVCATRSGRLEAGRQ